MTSTSRDDLRAFYQAAFKPIMEEVGKAPSPETMNPSIPMYPYPSACMLDDMMRSEMYGKVQPSVPKPIDPVQPIEPSIAMLHIFELKVKLAKLEEKLYRVNGGQMKQTYEALVARLESSNLDHVIKALDILNHILSKDLAILYSFEPYLKESVDRIVLLCAQQYRHFFTTYLVPVNLIEENPEKVNLIQKFLDKNTKLVYNLLVVDKLKQYITKEALHELMLSIVPYLVWQLPESGIDKPFHSITFQNVQFFVSDLLDGYYGEAATDDYNAIELNPNWLIVASIVLRLINDFIVDLASKDIVVEKQASLSIDALTSLVNTYLIDFCHGGVNKIKNLNAVVYEIYSLFELASEMKSSPLDNNFQILEKLKSYICSIFTALGVEAAWEYFELVDKELALAGRDPREVALFKYLAGKGYARSGVQSEVSEVVKNISESEVNLNPVESNKIQQQQQDLKDNFVYSLPEDSQKVVPLFKYLAGWGYVLGGDSSRVEVENDFSEVPEPVESTEKQDSKDTLEEVVPKSFSEASETNQESTTVEASAVSSISSLSKESNEEIYAEMQKLHQDLAKSQQMLHELLHKLDIN